MARGRRVLGWGAPLSLARLLSRCRRVRRVQRDRALARLVAKGFCRLTPILWLPALPAEDPQRWRLRLRGRRYGQRLLEIWERRFWAQLRARDWPPYPQGKRERLFERARRVRVVYAERASLLAVLVRRVRRVAGELPPCPPHGRLCKPGCVDCAAIMRWRRAAGGAFDLVVREYLYP